MVKVFWNRKSTILPPKQAIEIIGALTRFLPEGEAPEEFRDLAAVRDGAVRDDLFRKAYLAVETRLLTRALRDFPNRETIRRYLRERFRLTRVAPSRFSVFFLPRDAQRFLLSRLFCEELWSRAGWEREKKEALIRTAARETPLENLKTFTEEEWRDAFDAFTAIPESDREHTMVNAFRRVVEGTFHALTMERGEERTRIFAEEVARNLHQNFATLEAISSLLDILPEGILSEERVTFASREELAETVARQMRELKGKNIALIAEANQLHETIRELKEAKERLEAMASAQRDFITVVSHQFRTPLAAIRWQSDMLLETTSGKPELHDIAAMAELIHERSVFLIDVLENIFDLLAIEAGEFQLSRSPTKLSVLVEKACGEREKDAERKHLTLMRRINADDELLLDPNVIHRVLTVLLVNAINYSNDGGTVEISVDRRSGGERGSEMIVSVRDEGIGIRPEDRPRIFEKFFRAKNAVATVPDGAGIALYLAKRMVELHGGKIWVESPGMGGGSTFFFTIPLNDAMETQETASTTPNAPS